ncbi:fluoride efflux transporter CrcB [Parendozoicomonas haliclonae]|nr:fluoride efflux transporter CrcB [Parendozoicomonas haliclonae]
MWTSILAIGLGAAVGANLRWALGLLLNPVFAGLPSGTLAANWLGCYLIGIALPALNALVVTTPEIRLFIVTGFLGALTTFSSFSADMIEIMQEGRFGWFAGAIVLHVMGSLAFTLLGMGTVHLIQNWGRF